MRKLEHYTGDYHAVESTKLDERVSVPERNIQHIKDAQQKATTTFADTARQYSVEPFEDEYNL